MAEKIPLIPEKGYLCTGNVCADVRSALHRLLPVAPLPVPPPPLPLQVPDLTPSYSAPSPQQDLYAFKEVRLREMRAQMLSRGWTEAGGGGGVGDGGRLCGCRNYPCECDLVERNDVLPDIRLGGGLWLKAALKPAAESREREGQEWHGAALKKRGTPPPATPPLLGPPLSVDGIVSMGASHTPPPPTLPPPQSSRVHRASHFMCLPSAIDFINCVSGRQYTRTLVVVNTGRKEVRMSVRPPSRPELSVTLGAAGLRMTAGASSELRVHCTPRDVRAFSEELQLRLSVPGSGAITVPIACYTQPPLLRVVSCAGDGAGTGTGTGAVEAQRDELDLGARLLGEAHSARLELSCSARHAHFYLMSEEAWQQWEVPPCEVGGACLVDGFVVRPREWRGGRRVPGTAWFRAPAPGLHVASLRVLSSTATARSLHILADSIMHSPGHVTLQAQPKECDINSDEDPACQHYLLLETRGEAGGGGQPTGALSLSNHSPVAYQFSWSVREWRGRERCAVRDAGDVAALRVLPARGSLPPRASLSVRVRLVPAPATATPREVEGGEHHGVLQLLLHDVPRASLPPALLPSVVSERAAGVAGEQGAVVCAVVAAQVEVWWQVPRRCLVLQPCRLALHHSRRVKQAVVSLRALVVRLDAGGGRGRGRGGGGEREEHKATAELELPAGEAPQWDEVRVRGAGGQARLLVQRHSVRRHPALRPPHTWLGVVAPGTDLRTTLRVHNDTYEQVYWWVRTVHWSKPGSVMENIPCQVCHQVRTCHCTALRPRTGRLSPAPAPGAPPRAPPSAPCEAVVQFQAVARQDSGVELWLAQAHRSAGGEACPAPAAPVHTRAALVACRTQAARLLLHVVEHPGAGASAGPVGAGCAGVAQCQCQRQQLRLEAGGGALLRPAEAVGRGRTSLYRLQIQNVTPQPTTLVWEHVADENVPIFVEFTPNEIEIPGNSSVKIQVSLRGMVVTSRRLWACRGRVRSGEDLYLLIDAAVQGESVCVELPGGVMLRRTQQILFEPTPERMPSKDSDSEEEEAPEAGAGAEAGPGAEAGQGAASLRDIYREQYLRPQHKRVLKCACAPTCLCPPLPQPALPLAADTRCGCGSACWCSPALQFLQLPVNEEREQHFRVHNSGATCTVVQVRCVLPPGEAGSGAGSGRGLQVRATPARLVVPRGRSAAVRVAVRALWAGPHRAVLELTTERCTLLVHLWVDAQGAPLRLLAKVPAPPAELGPRRDDVYTLWMSASDPERTVRARNQSGAALHVRAYIVKKHENWQEALPLRLLFRLTDAPPPPPSPTPPPPPPPFCICDVPPQTGAESSESWVGSSESGEEEQPLTDVELYVAPDYGAQDDRVYQVSPESCTMEAGEHFSWRVRLRRAGVGRGGKQEEEEKEVDEGSAWDTHVLVLRVSWAGAGAGAGMGGTERVLLRRSEPPPELVVAPSCLRTELCGLKMRPNDVTRIRKTLLVRNLGSGPLHLTLRTGDPLWRVSAGAARAAGEGGHHPRGRELLLSLLHSTSAEMCVEVEVETSSIWPGAARCTCPCPSPAPVPAPAQAAPPAGAPSPASPATDMQYCLVCSCYPPRRVIRGDLTIHSGDQLLQKVPLYLSVRLPRVRVVPPLLELGAAVSGAGGGGGGGEARCGYYAVKHTAGVTLQLVAEWRGDAGFTLQPRRLAVTAGGVERVYLKYRAGAGACAGAGGVARGAVVVRVCGPAGAWCRGEGAAQVRYTRDSAAHAPPHDYTNNPYPETAPPPRALQPPPPSPPPPPRSSSSTNTDSSSQNSRSRAPSFDQMW